MTKAEQTLALAQEKGVLRARDLNERGIARTYLQKLYQQGKLLRSGRGLYFPAESELTEHHSLAEAAKRVPNGIVCLSSALRFHQLTTQNPWQVWLLIETGAWTPKVDYPPLLVFHASGEAFSEGVEEHQIEGVTVRITNVAKTVADCFKYRNKIGLDVALEALRETLRERRTTRDEIHHYARICRVEKVMRPYMEALT